MTFLNLTSSQNPKKYNTLGYLENPFPKKGKVSVEVYVERPELQDLQVAFKNLLVNSQYYQIL